MMGRKAARNMQSRNTNKIGIQCICWFYSQGICYDARSYDRKIKKTGNVRITCHWGAFVQPLLAWKRNKYYRLRVYVLALGIQHAMRMSHVIICGLSGSTLFSTYHIDGKILGKTLQNIKYVFWFLRLSETFLALRRIQWDVTLHVRTCYCIVLVILVRF
jgi:hypothetical protein